MPDVPPYGIPAGSRATAAAGSIAGSDHHEGAHLLRGDRRHQPLAALCASTLDHRPATGGAHAGAKAMGTLAADPARLVGPLHDRPSSQGAGTRSRLRRSPSSFSGAIGAASEARAVVPAPPRDRPARPRRQPPPPATRSARVQQKASGRQPAPAGAGGPAGRHRPPAKEPSVAAGAETCQRMSLPPQPDLRAPTPATRPPRSLPEIRRSERRRISLRPRLRAGRGPPVSKPRPGRPTSNRCGARSVRCPDPPPLPPTADNPGVVDCQPCPDCIALEPRGCRGTKRKLPGVQVDAAVLSSRAPRFFCYCP